MIEFEACTLAGEMLRCAGFEHRYTSMKSEATYYGWPGRSAVIRVACHRASRSELNGVPILATITFNARNFKTDAAGVVLVPRSYAIRLIEQAVGKYMLTTSGVVKARRKFRDHWAGGDAELAAIGVLTDAG